MKLLEGSNGKLSQTRSGKRIGLIIIVVVVVLAFVGGFWVSNNIWNKKQANKSSEENLIISEEVTVDESIIREVISPAKELITYKYFYTDVGEYTKDKKLFKATIPFTTDKTIYTYTGEIGAGIDLEDVDFDINDHIIVVSLPSPKILYHEMDKDEVNVYDVKNSVFTTSSLEDFVDFEKELKEKQESKLKERVEFWDNVKQNTKTVISDLMTASGKFEKYSVVFEWN